VKEFMKKVNKFQKKLIEHQNLYSHDNSFPKFSGGMKPVRNLDELQEQSCWLNRWWGENQSILNQFRNFQQFNRHQLEMNGIIQIVLLD